MLATKPAIQAEMKALQELVELYIASNPNYMRTKEEAKPVEVVVEKVNEDEVISKSIELYAHI
jgi:hypothetical protein